MDGNRHAIPTRTVARAAAALLVASALALACSDAPQAERATSSDVCDSAPVRGAGFDAYGGWKGVATSATGRFQVAQVDGIWWLITPEGHGLFSNGVTGIDPEGDVTASGSTPYGDHILARYGSVDAWAAATLDRMCDLGVATLAAWTNSAVDLFTGKRAYPV